MGISRKSEQWSQERRALWERRMTKTSMRVREVSLASEAFPVLHCWCVCSLCSAPPPTCFSVRGGPLWPSPASDVLSLPSLGLFPAHHFCFFRTPLQHNPPSLNPAFPLQMQVYTSQLCSALSPLQLSA